MNTQRRGPAYRFQAQGTQWAVASSEPHPTDRREAKRGMIRAMLCFVVGMYLFAVIVS